MFIDLDSTIVGIQRQCWMGGFGRIFLEGVILCWVHVVFFVVPAHHCWFSYYLRREKDSNDRGLVLCVLEATSAARFQQSNFRVSG